MTRAVWRSDGCKPCGRSIRRALHLANRVRSYPSLAIHARRRVFVRETRSARAAAEKSIRICEITWISCSCFTFAPAARRERRVAQRAACVVRAHVRSLARGDSDRAPLISHATRKTCWFPRPLLFRARNISRLLCSIASTYIHSFRGTTVVLSYRRSSTTPLRLNRCRRYE